MFIDLQYSRKTHTRGAKKKTMHFMHRFGNAPLTLLQLENLLGISMGGFWGSKGRQTAVF